MAKEQPSKSMTETVERKRAKRMERETALAAILPTSDQKLLVELSHALPANGSVSVMLREKRVEIAVPSHHALASASWLAGSTSGGIARSWTMLPLSETVRASIVAWLNNRGETADAVAPVEGGSVDAVGKAPETAKPAKKRARGAA